MTPGLEALLISGGAQFIIDRMASKVSDDVLPEIKEHLQNEPDIEGAKQAARRHEVSEEFQRSISEFEEQTGVKVEEYSMTYSTDE